MVRTCWAVSPVAFIENPSVTGGNTLAGEAVTEGVEDCVPVEEVDAVELGVPLALAVCVAELVEVIVGVDDDVAIELREDVRVDVLDKVSVAELLWVIVEVGVPVIVGEVVVDGVDVCVPEPDSVCVAVLLLVALDVEVTVTAAVGVEVEVPVKVGVEVWLPVELGVDVVLGVFVCVDVPEIVEVVLSVPV